MEVTETERGLTYEVIVAKAWPPGEPPGCMARPPDLDGRVHILKHPGCSEADIDDMKERFKNDRKERNGMELAADALSFDGR